jgi:hypothetical protein
MLDASPAWGETLSSSNKAQCTGDAQLITRAIEPDTETSSLVDESPFPRTGREVASCFESPVEPFWNRGYRISSTSCCALYILVKISRIAALFIAMDLHQVPNRLSCCPGLPDQGLVPPQRRAPLSAFHAATPGANSFLRRSVARKRFCFPHRFAW